MAAPVPVNEAERLAVLRDYQILDTPPEAEFDALVRLAAHACDTPFAGISLIDAERQWFKSVFGFDVTEIPREVAICAHTILQSDVLIIPDVRTDPRCAAHPFVAGPPNIRFYAGVPLVTEDGYALGTLCVIDLVPRDLTAGQKDALQTLARQILHGVVQKRREREHLAAIVENAADAIISTELDGRIVSWNVAAEQLYGYSAEEMIGRPQSILVPPGETSFHAHFLQTVIEAGKIEALEVVRRRKDGERIDVCLTLSVIRDAAGRAVGVSAIGRDITARKRQESAVRQSEAGLRAILESAPIILYAADAAGTVTLSEGMGLAVLGLMPGEAVGQSLTEFIGGDLQIEEYTRRAMAGEAVSFDARGIDLCLHTELRPLTDAEGIVTGIIGVCLDVTERMRAEDAVRDHGVLLQLQKRELERANAALETLATTDGLTGLFNHRTFQERLSQEIIRATRYGTPLSLVMIDVDHFKHYNDRFGHPAGDEILRLLGVILQACARETDLAARYGGEEFALILPQTDGEGAAVIAERVRAAIAEGQWPRRAVTASLGVASLTPEMDDGGDLIACADAAMYQSKTEGRNCVTSAPFFTPSAE